MKYAYVYSESICKLYKSKIFEKTPILDLYY